MIRCWVGPSGSGKSLSLVRWFLREMRRREGYSQFYVVGAKPVAELSLLHDARFRGAVVALAEFGQAQNARDFAIEDPVETAWLRLHRHYGQDIGLDAQDPMDIAVSVRRNIELWTWCTPVPHSDRASELLATGRRVPWYKRPQWIWNETYHREQLDANFQPRPGEAPVRRLHWFDLRIARMYDSADIIMTGEIKSLLTERLGSAESMATGPFWEDLPPDERPTMRVRRTDRRRALLRLQDGGK
jgi:hypothetical protein